MRKKVWMHAVNTRSYIFFRHLATFDKLVHKKLRRNTVIAIVRHVAVLRCHEYLISLYPVRLTLLILEHAILIVVKHFEN